MIVGICNEESIQWHEKRVKYPRDNLSRSLSAHAKVLYEDVRPEYLAVLGTWLQFDERCCSLDL